MVNYYAIHTYEPRTFVAGLLRRVALPLVLVTLLFIGFSTAAQAQEPPENQDEVVTTVLDEPLTPVDLSGDAQESGQTPVSPAQDEIPTDQTVHPAPPAVQMRVAIEQLVRRNFNGTFRLTGHDLDESLPISAVKGNPITIFLMVPEHLGVYRLEVIPSDSTTPALWMEGDLQRESSGHYQHRLIGAGGDPATFAFNPDRDGVAIALGSVRGYLQSCIHLHDPQDALLELGVDFNSDGTIDPADEVVAQPLVQESQACVATPETLIPLTTRYQTKVVTTKGDTLARNTGLYDFVNKTSIGSEKEAPAQFVRQFEVSFVRTPYISEIRIPNTIISPPLLPVESVPQTQEETQDAIRNGPDEAEAIAISDQTGVGASSLQDSTSAEVSAASSSAASSSAGEWLRKYWMLLILAIAILVGLILLLQRQRSV